MSVAIFILIAAGVVGAVFAPASIAVWGIGVALLVMLVAFVGTALVIAAFSLALGDAGVFDAMGVVWDGFVGAVIAESGPVVFVLGAVFVGYCGLGILGVWLGKRLIKKQAAHDDI